MDPLPPPLVGWPQPPPLPPPVSALPPAPPAWPTPAYQDVGKSHLVQWTLGTMALLAVAALLVVLFVGQGPAALTSIPAPRQTASAASATPSTTPVSAAIAQAAQQYLAAVASVNADGNRFHAALLADESLPCTCSPGNFEVRTDAIAVIPAIDRDTEALQVVLETIKQEVPAITSDVDTVVADNQAYMGYLAAAYRASQVKNGAVGLDINEAETVDEAAAPDFVRLRSDLGLPPPPSA